MLSKEDRPGLRGLSERFQQGARMIASILAREPEDTMVFAPGRSAGKLAHAIKRHANLQNLHIPPIVSLPNQNPWEYAWEIRKRSAGKPVVVVDDAAIHGHKLDILHGLLSKDFPSYTAYVVASETDNLPRTTRIILSGSGTIARFLEYLRGTPDK